MYIYIYMCVCVHAHAIIYLCLSIFSIGPGSNCKSDWDKFSRQCLDRKRFPISLAAHYQRDKLDLFRSWLSANEDWSKPLVFNSTSAHNIKRPKWVCPQGRWRVNPYTDLNDNTGHDGKPPPKRVCVRMGYSSWHDKISKTEMMLNPPKRASGNMNCVLQSKYFNEGHDVSPHKSW